MFASKAADFICFSFALFVFFQVFGGLSAGYRRCKEEPFAEIFTKQPDFCWGALT